MKSTNQIREQILDKATIDPEFRIRFKADPASALESDFGLSVPDGFNITVLEDDAHNAHIVLPPSATLSENELSAVSGGDTSDSHYIWDN